MNSLPSFIILLCSVIATWSHPIHRHMRSAGAEKPLPAMKLILDQNMKNSVCTLCVFSTNSYNLKCIVCNIGEGKCFSDDLEPVDITKLFHGDIIETEYQKRVRRSASVSSYQNPLDAAILKTFNPRWPQNIVPYEIDGSFTQYAKGVIAEAIEEYNQKTCIRFVPASSTDTDKIRIVDKGGCYSYVGRIGGTQDLSLGGGCIWKHIVIHELLHALGFFHEHARADRDEYVYVNYSNIRSGFEQNFDKVHPDFASHYGFPYDHNGIMHYSNGAFANNWKYNTISKRVNGIIDTSFVLGTSTGLSEKDVQELQKYYDCSSADGKVTSKPTTQPTTTKATTKAVVTTETTGTADCEDAGFQDWCEQWFDYEQDGGIEKCQQDSSFNSYCVNSCACKLNR